jgi:hypothetical protein
MENWCCADCREIKGLSRLGVRDDPNLEVIPFLHYLRGPVLHRTPQTAFC